MEQNQPITPNPVIAPINSVVKKLPQFDIKKNLSLIGVAFIVVALGILAGYLFSGAKGKSGGATGMVTTKTSDTEAGVADLTNYKDTAQGVLQEGGIGGEGTFHLVRPGGDSQNVYLTSTVIDMRSFVGKTVEVWGQTQSAKKAGWLMDIGKIKVIQ
jgi:hypothetical protein